MFGERIKAFKQWVDSSFLQITPENFEVATNLLLDVRNSLSHYPVQAAYNGESDTLTPFVYRASKEQMIIFDEHKITVLGSFISMVKSELQLQFNQINKTKNQET